MQLETERLVMRHWEDSDAEDLFRYAKDPDIGPIAGWPAHASVAESLETIRGVLSEPETYAICLKDTGRAIGCVGLKLRGHTDMTDRDDECELGYWIGKPYWGRGLMPEAVRAILRHAFEDLGMSKVWCAHFEDNAKSQRTQEKMGFKPYCVRKDVDIPLLGRKTNDHVNLMTREDWEKIRG